MQVIEQAKNILQAFLPLVVFMIAVLTTWGIVKWGTRISEAFKGLFESPERIVLLMVVMGVFLWIYFKYISPLLQSI